LEVVEMLFVVRMLGMAVAWGLGKVQLGELIDSAKLLLDVTDE
jgi:hypothetical protein